MLPLASADPVGIGPHRLLARLGAGGMGEVYLVRTPQGRLAALKVVKEDLARDQEFRARFAREVRTAQMVTGPFTPDVVDADAHAPAPWMATEYVPGPTLREAVREHGPFPEPSLRVLALGLANALQAIHSAGLMHRDLKPSNVLLSPRGPQVIDFGIARAVEGTVLTKTGQAFGTPAYASPEQVMGHETSPASDVFSLAGVVVFAATGRAPFGSGRAAEVLPRVVGADPNLDGVPEALRPLLTRCLAKDPAERPNADQIARTLSEQPLPPAEHGWLPTPINQSINVHQQQAQQVVHAVPDGPSWTAAAPRSPKKRRTGLIAAGAGTAALVLAAGIGLAVLKPWSDANPDSAAGQEEGGATGEGADASEAPGGQDDPDGEWDGETGFDSFVNDMAFTPDGSGVYVHTTDAMTLWDWESGDFRHRFDPKPSTFDLADDGTMAGTYADTTTVFGPDQEVLALFDLAEEDPEDIEEFGAVSISPDGSLVAMAVFHPGDPRLYVWDWEEDTVVFSTDHTGPVVGTDFTPDGEYLMVRQQYNEPLVTMYDVENLGDESPSPEGPHWPAAHWNRYAFSPAGPVVAVELPDEDIAVYDYGADEVVQEIETERDYLWMEFSSDGRTLYSAGLNLTAMGPSGGRAWDVTTGEELVSGDTLLVDILAVHPEDEVIATFADDTLLLLDPETLDVVNEIN
ncbi:hypothetical protein GCM10007079_52850 [Nocardiopsis terrae]|uniref:Protein kinase domain-containing protein n=1 Tax=Nocardiopsis terrae TaxID=372655 RepID=A0ABR9HA97_9ACTN|nr:serine/threonine-protein kinase [Nocardiopsis terrae]MBE1455908.1 hypothetical protein [Nocardiopsis terrae]GHC98458.1 hypothetical protein GCM10007079_52850 [Nocardiopsis terrae]